MTIPAYAKCRGILGTVDYLGTEIEVRSPSIAEMLALKDVFSGLATPMPRAKMLVRIMRWLLRRPAMRPAATSDFDIMAVMFPQMLVGWEGATRADLDVMDHKEARSKLMLDVTSMLGVASTKKPVAGS